MQEAKKKIRWYALLGAIWFICLALNAVSGQVFLVVLNAVLLVIYGILMGMSIQQYSDAKSAGRP